MRSPGSRRIAERGLRLTSIALLGWLFLLALHPVPTPGPPAVATGGTLATALERWTTSPAIPSIHAELDYLPDAITRDWLAALAAAGSRVSWSARDAVPAALVVERAPDPRGAVRVRVAAPSGTSVTLRDLAGAVDSARASRGGASFALPLVVGTVEGAGASAAVPESLALRPLLVIARAGWEGKFVAAALAERGWTVETSFEVAPGVAVGPAYRRPLDTTSYAAVIALDSSAAAWSAPLVSYAANGGGVVIAGKAARLRSLAPLLPGTPGARTREPVARLASVVTPASLPILPITALVRDAVPLESRDGSVTAAARRVGAGRVVQVAYDETWRWRLAGADGSREAHRAWWAGVVSAVAYAATPGVRVIDSLDAAPYAHVVASLGRPGSRPASPSRAPRRDPTPAIALALFAFLLAEWASRRLRGAP